MIVKKLEGRVVIIIKELSPGFHRGVSTEYLAFSPELAQEIGQRLVSLAQELKIDRDRDQDA